MAPNATGVEEVHDHFEKPGVPQAGPRKYEICKTSLSFFTYYHVAAVYGLYLCFASAMWTTIIFEFVLLVLAIIGITAGAHRLWSHKSYKAKLPLQIILMLLTSLACQYTASNWVRDHRMHHMYTDTDANPHNSTRGFFYSHIGWLLVKKHPEVKKRGKSTDLSDIHSNPVLMFQKKYAIPLLGSVCFLIPTLIPIYCWGETLNNAWHLTLLRFVLNLNCISLINSASHMWGYKPYDKNIKPTQNLGVTLATLGEGYHNYHHVFPWDYRAAEFGNYKLNLTTMFINFFAWVGWAYDLKTVPEDVIKARVIRTGDGTIMREGEDKNKES